MKEGSVVKAKCRYQACERGLRSKVQVVETGSEEIFIDVGLKNEGRISVSKFQMVQSTELQDVCYKFIT